MTPITQKFHKEIAVLKSLGKEEALHPLRRGQIKQAMLRSIAGTPDQTESRGSWRMAGYFRYAFVAVAGFVLAGGTVFASASSVPGEMLYPVKKVREKLELKLMITEQARAKMEAKHAETRFKELEMVKLNPKKAEHQQETEDEAKVQVSSALQTLTEVKTRLEDKGNTQAAAALESNIQRIRERALQANIELENETEEQDKDGLEPEGQIKGSATEKTQPGQDRKSDNGQGRSQENRESTSQPEKQEIKDQNDSRRGNQEKD